MHFTIVATVIFLLASFVWSRDGWHNLLIKAGLFAMMVWGILVALVQLGYLTRP